jgi:tetratricopeptide (TPR) repeat protein
MQKRRRPFNWFGIFFLLIAIGGAFYFKDVIAPTISPPFVPTPTATREPESYVAEAQALFEDGKFLQAISAYEDAIRSKPDDDTVYVALARVQIFAGQCDKAQVSAENALLLNTNNAMAYAVRASAMTCQDDYLGAEAAIKEALTRDPNNGIAHAYYAELLVQQYLSNTGPFDAIELAATESRTALALAPNTVEAHRARGYVYEVTESREEAISEYQAAIALNPKISDLYIRLGRTYAAVEAYAEAVDAYITANTLNPTDPTPDYLISRVYARTGDYVKAIQFAQQAVANNPTDAFLHGNLGVVLYRNLQRAAAVPELRLVVNGGQTTDGKEIKAIPLTNSGRIPEFYNIYALALARTGECGEAIQVANSILFIITNDETVIFNANEAIRICQESLTTPAPSTP